MEPNAMEPAPIPLDAVISNEELSRRAPRPRDRDAEWRAFESLAEELAGTPRRVLQKLSDVALELCQAHSAGISLLEEDNGRRMFRWHAVSGRWAAYLWNTLPREFSPCGTVLDREAAQLMILPERYFTPLAQVSPQVAEVLLIPFSVHGEIVGTVWVIAHEPSRRFDRGDLEVVSKLAEFAALAYQRLSSLSADDVLQLARLNKAHSLPRESLQKAIQRRVLIIDDNQDVAEPLALLLRDMGHQVHAAQGGRAGLEIARRVRPDIVLLDIAMPDMSGYEVAKELRQFLGASVRIVAVTGYGQDEDRRLSLEAGFDQHLVKPVDAEFLKSLTG
jgi:CheY-like chemotaxis protein